MVDHQHSSSAITKKLIIGLAGVWPTDEEWLWLKQWQPSGVILFSRNVESFSQLHCLCRSLKQWVPGLEIMSDHEGGPVSQLAAGLGRPPVAWLLGKLDDEELTARVHEETGRRMKLAGLDRVLGPCADVMTEPRNPVIGSRAFGSDFELVSRQVGAAVTGLKRAGLSCCLKHWPGHGSSGTDSHLENSTVSIGPRDEAPFLNGLKSGADAVMVGHLLFDDTGLPATLSSDFLEKTRITLGTDVSDFILMADDVSMGALREPMAQLGIASGVSPESNSKSMVEVDELNPDWFEALLNAGCDQMLLRGIPFSAFPRNDQSCEITDSKFPKYSVPSEKHMATPDFSDGPYNDARRPSIFDVVNWVDELVYLDLARADRWQVAGGQNADHWRQWDIILNDKFNKIWQCSHLNEAHDSQNTMRNLLLTSHRPLPLNWEKQAWGQSIKNCMADSGLCLVMGHPSLALELEAFLGAKWDVEMMYDVCIEDLRLVFG